MRKGFLIALGIVIIFSAILYIKYNILQQTNITANLIKKADFNKDTKIIDNKENIKANNDFSNKFLKEIATKDDKENILVSPMSLYLVLSMTYNGANGETKNEFAKLLGNKDAKKLNEYNQQLIYNFYNLDINNSIIANSIWIRGNSNKDFTNTCKNYYFSEVKKLKTKKEINKWVKKNTNGKITNIIDKVYPNDKAILINTLYFDANWSQKFNKKLTKEDNFYLENNKTIKTNFMNNKITARYLELESCDILKYDYKDSPTSMYFILPKENIKIADCVKNLNFNDLFNKKYQYGMCTLKIPKFKIEKEYVLNNNLINMQLRSAFDIKKADFSKISNEDLYISKILQKSAIDVSEEKTVAISLTSNRTWSKSAPMVKKLPKPFIFNRPFIFAIGDNSSKSILFAGVMYDPSKY